MQHKATRSRKTLVERNEAVAWHPPAAVQALAIERRLRRGEILFRSGDRAVGLYAVEEGSIRLSRLDADGHEIVLHSAGPGDLVAEASLFSSHYHCEAVATADARVRLFPANALLAELRRDPQAA